MQPNSRFFENLPENFVLGTDAAQHTLFREYGAVFVARGGAIPPPKVVFENESDVDDFQSQLDILGSTIGGFDLELQRSAMEALLSAMEEAGSEGLSIGPRGRDSARRTYNVTVALWHSRVEPALVHWVEQDRITQNTADEIRSLSPYDQVSRVFELEEEGIFFAKDLSKSIIYSVAPPGASQHLSLLAFDVAEFDNRRVREILAAHHWYQTVVSDLPHFTFLGVPLNVLPDLGLTRVEHIGRGFWIPRLNDELAT